VVKKVIIFTGQKTRQDSEPARRPRPPGGADGIEATASERTHHTCDHHDARAALPYAIAAGTRSSISAPAPIRLQTSSVPLTIDALAHTRQLFDRFAMSVSVGDERRGTIPWERRVIDRQYANLDGVLAHCVGSRVIVVQPFGRSDDRISAKRPIGAPSWWGKNQPLTSGLATLAKLGANDRTRAAALGIERGIIS
jgi:hypothetical protein